MSAALATSGDAGRRVGHSLERLAGSLASRALFYSASPEALVDAQIALALEHMAHQRTLRDDLLKHLLRSECALDTLVLPLPGHYLQHDPALKLWVRDRLLAIEVERRQVVVEHERRVGELESQLLQLMSQRVILRETSVAERR